MESRKYIQLHFTRRGLVRLVSYLCALVLVLGAGTAVGYRNAAQYRILLEDSYAQALTGLASNLTGISTTLSKGVYAATPTQVSLLSAQLWRDASAAKTSLADLPLTELHLENTNRFLSQIGDYAMVLSRKSVSGAEISAQERRQFAGLCQYGRSLAQQFGAMEQQILEGSISMESIRRDIKHRTTGDGAQPPEGDSLAAFDALEESFSDYPNLEYDGPFSDHLTNRAPVMLEGAKAIPYEQAQELAAQVARVSPADFEGSREEKSQLAGYTFYSENLCVSVTAQGGYPSYLMKYREPKFIGITNEDALRAASAYLRQINLHALVPTYYQNAGNVCTINFAYTQGDITVYPDLVKVSVALDNAEILGLDTRGYLFNHRERTPQTPAISLAQAKAVAGKNLAVQSSRLAIIPTAGQNEVLCYELTANAENGDHVLLYVNAQTGVEEQIMLLTEDETGRMAG